MHSSLYWLFFCWSLLSGISCFLYFCIPILLITRFTYNCVYLNQPASFLWDTSSLLLTNRLSFFVDLFVENFCRPTTSRLVFYVLTRLKTINYITNGGSFLSLTNKMVNRELFSQKFIFFRVKNITEFWGSLYYSISFSNKK